MRLYLEILRVPLVGRLIASSLLARLPIGINGLAIVLMVQAKTDSFAIAGAAAGALALGTSVVGPLNARLIDSRGVHMLSLLAVCSAATLVGLIFLTDAGAPAAALVATAFVTGATYPPVSSVARTQYPTLLGERPKLMQGAFALDTVTTELIFTAAPLLTAALMVLFAPSAALFVSAGALVLGTLWLVSGLPAKSPVQEPAEPRTGGQGGALAAPGIRTLVMTMLPIGFAFGSVEVALPAFAEHVGRPQLAGVLIALWALGSVVGGLAYGARPRRGTLAAVHLRIALALPLGFIPLALAWSPASMALLVIPAGLMIAPLIATRNELAGELAPAGAATEAFTWPLTAIVGGIAIGAATAGALADAAGWQAAVVAAIAASAISAAISAGRRATLAPAT